MRKRNVIFIFILKFVYEKHGIWKLNSKYVKVFELKFAVNGRNQTKGTILKSKMIFKIVSREKLCMASVGKK